MRLFIFGAGYSGLALARRLAGTAEWIGGTTRHDARLGALRDAGIEPFLFDGTQAGAGVSAALQRATHVVMSIAPEPAGDPVLIHHGADLASAPALDWLGYWSTIGVYGDHGGAHVDETAECRPVSARSKLRLEIEQAWQAFAAARGVPVAVMRLAGIYGPGRNAFVKLAEGTARRLVKPGQVFNRIHVDDIATVTAAAMERRVGGIFNVCDDEPAPPQDVIAYAAGLMGVPPPPEQDFATADLSPMARSFYGENKRCRNGKLNADLGVTLAHPTYREAHAAMWAAGDWR
ncbi:SDR family oxidoreductase [Methylobrevis pamukkalensis]|uniref:NAD dependent epimerase/dehydratase family protein n=1 Tax=Methylobrevis pamukkalensis TaxID=1439726 RepID=A0A1E3H4Q9_9HYPH|nr:SDR family oxidoreductase [Methylobrevis pamukkalensis]ODN71302.1 NAD dependent epimerase/dehydratase family protein [Methylobrevis pamukkalensis]